MASRKPLSKILNGVTRFGRLTVLGDAPDKISPSGFAARCALVRCDCGTEKIVRAGGLSHGHTSSCGCFQRAELGKAARLRERTHGESRGSGKRGTTEFIIWSGMNQRCYCKAYKDFRNYGGRGIRICDRWRGPDGFANFLADMGRRPSKKHSIDRINNDGNYEPSNCRWATASEQARNRRPFMIYPKNWKGARMDKWQPIETAPKDRPIIIYDGAYVVAVWWDEPGEFRTVDGTSMPFATHWMPLPQAPLRAMAQGAAIAQR